MADRVRTRYPDVPFPPAQHNHATITPRCRRDRPDTWTILDADGRSLARIELRPRARPLDAGKDYVLFHPLLEGR